MKHLSIKKILTLTAISTLIGVSLNTLADTPAPGTGGDATLAAINNKMTMLNNNMQVVGNRIQAVAEANQKIKNNIIGGGSVDSAMQNNILYAYNKSYNETTAAQAAANNVLNQLQPLSILLVQSKSSDANSDAISALQTSYNPNITVQKLTAGVLASDTIYSTNQSAISLSQGSQNNLFSTATSGNRISLAKPKATRLHDDYFNFNTLMAPLSYTADPNVPDQKPGAAAKMYVEYLTKSYIKPSDLLEPGFKAFNAALNQAPSLDEKAGNPGQAEFNAYYALLSSKAYRKFQLAARSQAAADSVIQTNYSNLISERTPIKGLGTKAGVTKIVKDPKTGKMVSVPVQDASPLELQGYLANHRTADPAWYMHVRTASSADVQRETLVVLAEIEAQNFQAHLDRERLLATTTAQMAQASAMMATALSHDANDVNDLMKNIQKNNTATPQDGSTPPDNGKNNK